MTDTLGDIVLNNYGGIVKCTFTENGVAADISSYTTIQIIFTSPAGVSTTKGSDDGVAFFTDGTDGIITYTVESGLLSSAGTWTIRGKLIKANAQLTSIEKTFDVAHV